MSSYSISDIEAALANTCFVKKFCSTDKCTCNKCHNFLLCFCIECLTKRQCRCKRETCLYCNILAAEKKSIQNKSKERKR